MASGADNSNHGERLLLNTVILYSTKTDAILYAIRLNISASGDGHVPEKRTWGFHQIPSHERRTGQNFEQISAKSRFAEITSILPGSHPLNSKLQRFGFPMAGFYVDLRLNASVRRQHLGLMLSST